MEQYHHVTAKHLNRYMNEFCFRHNGRNNDSTFETVILKALTI